MRRLYANFVEGIRTFGLLGLLVAAGCAADPRRTALHEEMLRLREDYYHDRISQEEAHARLDEKTAKLYGAQARFCETYYPRSFRYPSAYDNFGYPRERWNFQRTFPGCYVEDFTAAPPPVIRYTLPPPPRR